MNHVYIRIWSSSLTFTGSQGMEANIKISQFSSFLLISGYAILVKIWKWLKLLNFVLFIKKWLQNHVYIRIWSSWLTFTVSQRMKAIFKISAKVRVSDSGQNLKMTKTSQFCTIHQETTSKSSLHLNLMILTDFHSFTVNKKNSKNSQFSSFLLRSGYAI